MARKASLSEEEKKVLAAQILKLKKKDQSWDDLAEQIKNTTGISITGPTLIAASKGMGAERTLAAVESFTKTKASSWTQQAPERRVELTERYHTIAIVFARARAAGVKEEVLDAARLRIGLAYSDHAPTEEQVELAIRAEVKAIEQLRSYIFDLDGG